jgi:hypothetical protein
MVEALLKAHPEQSNCQIAREAKVTDKTVAAVRRGLKATSGIPRREAASEIPAAAAQEQLATASVAFMITAAMKDRLRAAGYSDAGIFEMTPAQAHAALGGIASAPPPGMQAASAPAPHTNGPGRPQPVNGGLVPPWEDDDEAQAPAAPAAASAAPAAGATAPQTPPPGIAPPVPQALPRPPRGGSRAGTHSHSTKHTGEPFDDSHLLKNYVLKTAFPYTLPDGTLLYENVRYELKPGLTPGKKLKAKEFLARRKVNGLWQFGAGDRHVPYNWPAIMKAGPGSEVFVCEGESNAEALISRDFLATTALFHKWAPECVSALTGMHAIILEDFDTRGEWYAARAREALEPVAASIRVVPYGHLWSKLPEAARATPPQLAEDVKNWLEDRGGDPAALLDICREIPVKGSELEEWNAGKRLSGPLPPPRQWLTHGQFCRRFLGSLVAPGETGKTTLRLTQAIELATGRELLGMHIYARTKVLIICFEDDDDELQRRLLAICLHHKISPAELDGWLFCQTLTDGPKLARTGAKNRQRQAGELDGMLRRAIARTGCGLLLLDPFVGLHDLNENDNPDMNFVCGKLIKIAQDCNIAVDAPAHTHKGVIAAGDADARRGASAQRDAGRLDYTLTVMTEDEAEALGIAPEDRRQYVQLHKAKANIVRAMKAQWYRLINVDLGNTDEVYTGGDSVQAIECWAVPEVWEGVDPALTTTILDVIAKGLPDERYYSPYASAGADRQAWRVVAIHCPAKREALCKEIIKQWIAKGVLFVDSYDNPNSRKPEKGLFVDDSKRPRQPSAQAKAA